MKNAYLWIQLICLWHFYNAGDGYHTKLAKKKEYLWRPRVGGHYIFIECNIMLGFIYILGLILANKTCYRMSIKHRDITSTSDIRVYVPNYHFHFSWGCGHNVMCTFSCKAFRRPNSYRAYVSKMSARYIVFHLWPSIASVVMIIVLAQFWICTAQYK